MNSPLRIFFLITSTIVSSSASLFSQSIAASLPRYSKSFETDISSINATGISGVALNPHTGTLFIANDESEAIYEISITGDLIRWITLSGFEDIEGIAYQSGCTFFVIEERRATLCRMELPPSGSGPVYRDNCTVLRIADTISNDGPEDVAYSAAANTVYVVNEMNPKLLYRVTLDDNGNPEQSFKNDPFSIEGVWGDAAGLYALSDGTLLILNQIANKLIGYSETGEILSELSCAMTKPEGITVNPDDNRIYIVGEPRQLAVFENSGNAARPLTERSSPSPSISLHLVGKKFAVVDYRLPVADFVNVEIVSPQGKLIAVLFKGYNGPGNHRLIRDMTGLPAGVYCLVVHIGSYKMSNTVVVD